MTNNNELDFDAMECVAHEIIQERIDQNEKWGDQSHLPSSHSANSIRQFHVLADRWKQINNARSVDNGDGSIAWDGILLEEVYEALTEIDPLLRRAELIQVAAVAVAEIEAIDKQINDGSYGAGYGLDLDAEFAALADNGESEAA